MAQRDRHEAALQRYEFAHVSFALRIVITMFALTFAPVAVLAVLILAAPIEPMLPSAGSAVCLATSAAVSTKVTLRAGPHAKASTDIVEQLTLRLARKADQLPQRVANGYSFDWRYDFRVTAKLRGQGTLHGGGQCDWVDDAGSHWQFDLSCFRDCEGGSLDLYRVPFRRSFALAWNYLRMHGCGTPGVTVQSTAMPTWFWLDATAEQDCQ
jgi:hypothetical protein